MNAFVQLKSHHFERSVMSDGREVNTGVLFSQTMNLVDDTMGDETMKKLNITLLYEMTTGFAVITGLLFLMLGLSTANGAIVDGGFEAGTPNPYWTESSTNFGTPICSFPGCGGANQAHTGDWWAWFGGATSYEASSLIAAGANLQRRLIFELLVSESGDC